MEKIIMLAIGIALILGTIASVIRSSKNTPINLRGFYGAFYWIISLGGLVGGAALIAFSFLS